MNYKEKFLKLFNFLIKNKDYTIPNKLNGKYITYQEKDRIEEWFKNGLLHRNGKPALIKTNGKDSLFGGWYISEWYQNGKLHRDDGPAIMTASGTKEWYQNGLLHRDDEPAIIEANGNKRWYQNGLLHREDGPAIYINNGNNDVEIAYYLNGIHYLKENFEEAKQKLKLKLELSQELEIAKPIGTTRQKKLKI